MNRHQLFRVMSGADRSALAALQRAGLSALAQGYAAGVAVRNRAFDLGAKTIHELPRPTLSVGNLTTGGTGKTPMTLELCSRLLQMGARPAILLRGYRSQSAPAGVGSDEATLLRHALGEDVPVEPDPDRAAAAARVIADHPEVTHFVLDDGFQHRRVRRDLDLVLLDATNPFGYDHLLPRGLLREPPGNLARASAVIITRADQVDSADLAALDCRVTDLTGRPPLAHAAHRWQAFRDQADMIHPLDHLTGQPVLACCAIGNPDAFFNTLADLHPSPLQRVALDDHHPYDAATLTGILEQARAMSAAAIVTTEKDYVKWRPILAAAGEPAKTSGGPAILRPLLHLSFLDGESNLDAMLHAWVKRFTTEAQSHSEEQKQRRNRG
jgi:tetraacyldisaccharide 4'-kinase